MNKHTLLYTLLTIDFRIDSEYSVANKRTPFAIERYRYTAIYTRIKDVGGNINKKQLHSCFKLSDVWKCFGPTHIATNKIHPSQPLPPPPRPPHPTTTSPIAIAHPCQCSVEEDGIPKVLHLYVSVVWKVKIFEKRTVFYSLHECIATSFLGFSRTLPHEGQVEEDPGNEVGMYCSSSCWFEIHKITQEKNFMAKILRRLVRSQEGILRLSFWHTKIIHDSTNKDHDIVSCQGLGDQKITKNLAKIFSYIFVKKMVATLITTASTSVIVPALSDTLQCDVMCVMWQGQAHYRQIMLIHKLS